MKTLKQLFKEISVNEDEKSDFGGQTSGELGSGNWSLSAADLNKQAQDPVARAKMTTHTKTSVGQLIGRIAQQFPPDSLVGFTQAEIDSFEKQMNDLLDTALWKAQQSADKIAQEPGTNAGAMPKRTGTQIVGK